MPFATYHGHAVVPGTTIRLLSDPEKMPGKAWGLPAVRSCPGAVFGEQAICSSCYANGDSLRYWPQTGKLAKRGGHYGREEAVAAQQARYDWTLRCLMTAEGRLDWFTTMTEAITRATRREPFFRIHDSGDFFSPRYVALWGGVMAACPQVHFWAPTRSWHGTPRILDALVTTRATLTNFTCRPSALRFGDPPPVVPGLDAGTTADADESQVTCPAHHQGNRCGACRRCWLDAALPQIYAQH